MQVQSQEKYQYTSKKVEKEFKNILSEDICKQIYEEIIRNEGMVPYRFVKPIVV